MVSSMRAICAVVAASLVVTLGGCSTPAPRERDQDRAPRTGQQDRARGTGQSVASARRQLRTIEGLSSTSIEVVRHRSGMALHHQLDVDVRVAPTARVADAAALVQQVVAVAWSVRGVFPDEGVYLSIEMTPQVSIGAAFAPTGWAPIAYNSGEADKPYLTVSARAINDELGRWPGEVPDLREQTVIVR